MPYYHRGCGGEIGLWSRKCWKCGKRWPLKALFARRPPKDMTYVLGSLLTPQSVAKRLPKWPRWARIVVTGIVLLVGYFMLVLIMRKLRGY